MRRYNKANNKYMKNFYQTQPLNYLMYLEADSLYGWATPQNLPEKDLTFFNISDHLKENEPPRLLPTIKDYVQS